MILAFLLTVLAYYEATVIKVTDGDSVRVQIPAWSGTPFEMIGVRIAGIDAPEHIKPPAKCALEKKRGLAASAFARTLVKPGDKVSVGYVGLDKYARIDATITLADGRDWGRTMIDNKFAAPYDGGRKQSWCLK